VGIGAEGEEQHHPPSCPRNGVRLKEKSYEGEEKRVVVDGRKRINSG